MAKKEIKQGYQPKIVVNKEAKEHSAFSMSLNPPKGGTGEVKKKNSY